MVYCFGAIFRFRRMIHIVIIILVVIIIHILTIFRTTKIFLKQRPLKNYLSRLHKAHVWARINYSPKHQFLKIVPVLSYQDQLYLESKNKFILISKIFIFFSYTWTFFYSSSPKSRSVRKNNKEKQLHTWK